MPHPVRHGDSIRIEGPGVDNPYSNRKHPWCTPGEKICWHFWCLVEQLGLSNPVFKKYIICYSIVVITVCPKIQKKVFFLHSVMKRPAQRRKITLILAFQVYIFPFLAVLYILRKLELFFGLTPDFLGQDILYFLTFCTIFVGRNGLENVLCFKKNFKLNLFVFSKGIFCL